MSAQPLPAISVIIPSYNHARYIETCLNSVYEDDYPEVEIVILDDGSTDESVERVSYWRETHPGRFRRFEVHWQENSGTCRTINRLVNLAIGDYVTVLASDDYLLPGGLLSRAHALNRNPRWLAVFGDCIAIDTDGRHVANSVLDDVFKANKGALLDEAFIAGELILRWSGPGPALMARRSCYDESTGVGLYDESLNLLEDRDYYLRLLAKGALGFIDASVAAYRVHGESVSNRLDVRDDLRLAQYRSNVNNRGKFTGSPKLWMRVVSLYWLTGLRYHARKNWRNALAHVLSRTLLKLAYQIHTFLFRLRRVSSLPASGGSR